MFCGNFEEIIKAMHNEYIAIISVNTCGMSAGLMFNDNYTSYKSWSCCTPLTFGIKDERGMNTRKAVKKLEKLFKLVNEKGGLINVQFISGLNEGCKKCLMPTAPSEMAEAVKKSVEFIDSYDYDEVI